MLGVTHHTRLPILRLAVCGAVRFVHQVCRFTVRVVQALGTGHSATAGAGCWQAIAGALVGLGWRGEVLGYTALENSASGGCGLRAWVACCRCGC